MRCLVTGNVMTRLGSFEQEQNPRFVELAIIQFYLLYFLLPTEIAWPVQHTGRCTCIKVALEEHHFATNLPYSSQEWLWSTVL